MKRIILLLFILATAISASAQKEATWWYFGYNQGLDFTDVLAGNASVPTRLCEGPLNQREGVFSISDADGKFLMASNGFEVFGRDRDMMTGSIATKLTGCGTSTQSGIVVPFPGDGNENKYYIFTVSCREVTAGRKPIAYTVVDMDAGEDTSDGKRGDFVAGKVNIELSFGAAGGDPSEIYENITAVPHTNGIDYWLITRTNRGFYAWQITPTEVSTQPTHLAATYGPPGGYFPGAPTRAQGGDGILRASADGKHIVCVSMTTGLQATTAQGSNLTYAAFDAGTGLFSNRRVFALNKRSIYGLEFSADAKYVYFAQAVITGQTHLGGVFRVPTDYITTTGSEVATITTETPVIYAELDNRILDIPDAGISTNIQMGPKGWLYMIKDKSPLLNIIKNLDAVDIADVEVVQNPTFFDNCGSSPTGIMGMGLPTFMPSYFFMGKVKFKDFICKNEVADYEVEAATGTGGEEAAYLKWEMGDEDNTVKYTGKPENGGWPTDDKHVISFAYKKAGDYNIVITPYRKNGAQDAILDQIERATVKISDCAIPVNPHLRSSIKKK